MGRRGRAAPEGRVPARRPPGPLGRALDELDAIAGSRDAADSRHLRELVSQLLVLLDGLEDRGRVLVIGTTNRPEDIDPAILRPGRIDRKVYLGPPNVNGRAALFAKLLAPMPLADDVRPEALAAMTASFTGAQIEHIVNEAGLLAVKETLSQQLPGDAARVRPDHFLRAIAAVLPPAPPVPRRGGRWRQREAR